MEPIKPDLQELLLQCCHTFDVELEDLLSKRNIVSCSYPRQLFCFVATCNQQWTIAEIAQAINREPVSVYHNRKEAINSYKIVNNRYTHPMFHKNVEKSKFQKYFTHENN